MLEITHSSAKSFVGLLSLALLLSSSPIIVGQPSGMPSLTYGSDRYSSMNCLDPETGRELYVGEAFTRSGRCIRVQCLGDLQLWEDRCQIPRLEQNCHRIPAANEFLDYPRCCPTYECKSHKIDGNRITDETRTYSHSGRLIREHIKNEVMVNPPVHITTTAYNRTDGSGTYYGNRYVPPPSSSSYTPSVFRIN